MSSIRLFHCRQGVVNESSTAFSISANRMKVLAMKKFNLPATFMLGVALT